MRLCSSRSVGQRMCHIINVTQTSFFFFLKKGEAWHNQISVAHLQEAQFPWAVHGMCSSCQRQSRLYLPVVAGLCARLCGLVQTC